MAVLGADRPTFVAYERWGAAELVPVHGALLFRVGRTRFRRTMLSVAGCS